MTESRRVGITGIGLITPIGFDEETFWNRLMAGQTGIRLLQAFDTTGYKTRIGAEVDSEQLGRALEAAGWKPRDRAVDMALLAAGAALRGAGLLAGTAESPTEQPIATIFGTGSGAAQSVYETSQKFFTQGARGVRPTAVPRCMANAISSQISMTYKLTGPNYVVVAACTSSTTAIGLAYRMIRDGYAEQVLCGGSDSVFDPGTFAAWDRLGAMSRSPDPGTACRPFAQDRNGCVLGEGAGALLLESFDSARRRGARVRAEICGYGESSDAGHITAPRVEGQVAAIEAALKSGGIHPQDLGLISAHGTATEANDGVEAASLRAALGDAVDAVPVVSFKSYFGHLLGASGVVEIIASVLGLEHGRVPPNLNLDSPDPRCNLSLVRGSPAEVRKSIVMKTSFAFGGSNAVLCLRRTP